MVSGCLQGLVGGGIDDEVSGVNQDGAAIGCPDACVQSAGLGGASAEVTRYRQILDDSVVLAPQDNPARVGVQEGAGDGFPEVALEQVAVGVIDTLPHDRTGICCEQLGAVAEDVGWLVNVRRFSEA